MESNDWLAVDLGGTFVDSITFDRETGAITVEKASTTPADPTEGVMNAVEKVGASLPNTETFVHGTTLGIIAFLERLGHETLDVVRFREIALDADDPAVPE